MSIATKYSPVVAWRTLAKDVFQLTRQGVNPATFRMSVKAIDSNNPGAGQKQIGFYFIDYWGTPFSIIGTTSTTIDVQDDFRTGKCPMSGYNGIVFQSVFNGESLYISPDNFQHLHSLAFNNYQKYASAITWANDPNIKKIPFASVEVPTISNYQTDQPDPEDNTKTINYQERYGDNPNVRCIIVTDANTEYQLQQMPQFTKVDGKIDSIWFYPGEAVTGRIIISKS